MLLVAITPESLSATIPLACAKTKPDGLRYALVTMGKAEPEAVAAPRRIVVVTTRRTAVPAVAVPRATAQHTGLARLINWISTDLTTQITFVSILTPFQHIAMHFIQAPRVRG